MRLFRIAAIMVMAGLVTGCAGLGDKFNTPVFNGGLSLTATVQNPITNEQQAGVELSATIARQALLAYARQPRCAAGVSRVTCSSGPVVAKLKKANRLVNIALVKMRDFLDRNQQVSAINAFNEAVAALRDFRATAYVEGIEIKAAP